MANHVLKCWPKYFQAMLDKRKDFEVRNSDRNFKVGDTVENHEWNPDTQQFTGRRLPPRQITFILEPGEMGLPAGMCVMALAIDDRKTVSELLEVMDKKASNFDEDGETWCQFCFAPLTEAAEEEHEKGKPEDKFTGKDFAHLTDCPLKALYHPWALEKEGQLRLEMREDQP